MKMRLKAFITITIAFLIASVSSQTNAFAPTKNSWYYQLKVYHYANSQQEGLIDNFLQNNFIPALHADGLNNIGVFKSLANDTVADKKLYVFIPFKSLKQWEKFLQSTANKQAETISTEYSNAAYDKPPFSRVESIFIKAFKHSQFPSAPKLTAPKSERVYELRSYESPTEKFHANKVHMFNEGGEIDLFTKLNFNAIFYGQVVFGARMPNLMYLTAFENMDARKEHWKTFGSDSTWKTLSAMKEYQHNVSKNEIVFARPTDYSDL